MINAYYHASTWENLTILKYLIFLAIFNNQAQTTLVIV